MMIPVRTTLTLSLLALLAGCGSKTTDDSLDQVNQDQTAREVAVQEDQSSPPVDVQADTVLPDLDVGIDFHLPDATIGCLPGEGCFLDKCTENSQCQSGWCVENMGEGVCSVSCQDECPPGWSCQHVAGSDPDVVYVCVPTYVNLCRPCSTGNDCKSLVGAEDVCVDYGPQGSFCGGACGPGQECPWGFSCLDTATVDGIETTQCVADAGVCPCTSKSVTLSLWTPCEVTTEFGTCDGKRVCTEDGLAECDALAPSLEECNGVDDDCDGDVDEGTCDDDNACTVDLCDGANGCSHEAQSGIECIDGDVCTTADHCEDGICVGSPVICDDKNPCTDDHCTPEGGCENVPNKESCDDGDPCTVADQCQEGSCHGYAVDCDCQTTADCSPLEDGNLCNGTLICDTEQFPHKCVVDTETVVVCPPAQGPEGICLAPACDPADGSCSLVPDHEGYACSVGDKCVVGQVCEAGSCVGGVDLNCEDSNECTADTCNAATGCEHAPIEGPCSDGTVCTSGDACVDGICQPGQPLECADNNPCTADSCDPELGCVHAPTIDPDASCCTTAADCPGDFAAPATCSDQETCQGFKKSAICQDNQCGSVVSQDDSACQGLAAACGLFKDILCTGEVEQVQQACLLTCQTDNDCDPLAYCDGVCKTDIANGEPCVDDNQCESGNCNASPGGNDWFCNASIHECAMHDGSGIHEGYGYCYLGDLWTCLKADVWEQTDCAKSCGYYLPVDACQGAKCLTCADSCSVDADCVPNAHCDGSCQEDLTDGEECNENSDCASGHCNAGICCTEGDCCLAAIDCPEGYAEPAVCNEQGECQGYRIDVACNEFVCSSKLVDDDSACSPDIEADNCGPFVSVFCNGNASQSQPSCLPTCTEDVHCDPGFHCDDGACVADVQLGSDCDENSDCANDLCHNGRCCQEACGTDGCGTGMCDETGTCTLHTSGQQNCAACHECDADGQCAPQTVSGAEATALGCDSGDEGCRYCDAGSCQVHTSGQQGCEVCHACDVDGACAPLTVVGAEATAVGCDAGAEACRSCDAGSCTAFTSGQQGCDVCHACDPDGQCAAATLDGAGATALGCTSGDEGCRRCNAGSCSFYTADQHGCAGNYHCNAQGTCEEDGPQYVDICFGGYPQNAYVSSYCPSGYSHYFHVCGASSISNYQYGPYYDDKYLASGGHCSCCCNCNSVCVRCQK